MAVIAQGAGARGLPEPSDLPAAGVGLTVTTDSVTTVSDTTTEPATSGPTSRAMGRPARVSTTSSPSSTRRRSTQGVRPPPRRRTLSVPVSPSPRAAVGKGRIPHHGPLRAVRPGGPGRAARGAGRCQSCSPRSGLLSTIACRIPAPQPPWSSAPLGVALTHNQCTARTGGGTTMRRRTFLIGTAGDAPSSRLPPAPQPTPVPSVYPDPGPHGGSPPSGHAPHGLVNRPVARGSFSFSCCWVDAAGSHHPGHPGGRPRLLRR